MKLIKKITPIEENFAKWYVDVIVNGKLIEYAPVKGTVIFRPNSFEIWEKIQENLNVIFKKNNIRNVYLPMLIPSSLFNQEKKHIEGFAPELATITKIGNTKLNEDIFVRPTSEVIFAYYFKKIIDSYKDLPILNNQWVNVLRWEKTTNPFLRNSEFLWQEGHTCHSNSQEAKEQTLKMINVYKKFLQEFLAIEPLLGQKTELEKFSGAKTTYTIEAMMKDGKALQCGTSHYFDQNFSKIYDIAFKNKENKKEFVYQTSWGISTRLIGAIIMNHGDNRGIIMPPKIAPIQVDILSLYSKNDDQNKKVNEITKKIAHELENDLRIRILNDDKSYGFKSSQSEIEGVPLRIEIGARDLEQNLISIVRRDSLEKESLSLDELNIFEIANTKLNSIHNNLYQLSKNRLNQNIVQVSNYDNFKKEIENKKFVKVLFDNNDDLEKKIKNETGATTRCIIDNEKEGNCFISNKKTKRMVIFARAY